MSILTKKGEILDLELFPANLLFFFLLLNLLALEEYRSLGSVSN